MAESKQKHVLCYIMYYVLSKYYVKQKFMHLFICIYQNINHNKSSNVFRANEDIC